MGGCELARSDSAVAAVVSPVARRPEPVPASRPSCSLAPFAAPLGPPVPLPGAALSSAPLPRSLPPGVKQLTVVGVLVLGSLWWFIGVAVLATKARAASAAGLPGANGRAAVVGAAALGTASQGAVLVLATCYACCKVCCVVRKKTAGRGRGKKARDPGPPPDLPTGLVTAAPEGVDAQQAPAVVRMPAHPMDGPGKV
jgi:hypothetical protein